MKAGTYGLGLRPSTLSERAVIAEIALVIVLADGASR